MNPIASIINQGLVLFPIPHKSAEDARNLKNFVTKELEKMGLDNPAERARQELTTYYNRILE